MSWSNYLVFSLLIHHHHKATSIHQQLSAFSLSRIYTSIQRILLHLCCLSSNSFMASQLSHKGKGKGKASSSRGSLDLSRLFTTRQQQERYETFFFQKKIMKPKYSTFVTFPEEVFTFPSVSEELGLCNLIGCHLDFFSLNLLRCSTQIW